MLKTLASVSLFLFLTSGVVQAAVITIEGTVKSVDAKKRTITVETKTKTLELDVSRKAKVSNKGKTAKFDSLKPGQKVKISYHDGLEIVLRIDVANSSSPRPEVLEVSELNVNGRSMYPWPSKDGLTIYWEHQVSGQGASIWTARRKNPDSFFENKKMLFKGRHPTVSADGLDMVVLVEGVLHSTSRPTIEGNFGRPRLIRELKDQPGLKNPSLSSDGLMLLFNRQSGSEFTQVVVSTRRTKKSKWASPTKIPIQQQGIERFCDWPSLYDNGRSLFCSNRNRIKSGKANLMLWSRKSANKPFSKYTYIELPDVRPLIGRSPRYVAATNELFFSSMSEDRRGIQVVKNYVPSE